MKLKIISDGTANGTKVINASTGEPILGVQMINFMATTDGECEALLSVVGVQCEIVCSARSTLLQDFNPYEAEDLLDENSSN